MSRSDELQGARRDSAKAGGAPKYHEKNAEQGKLFAASASRCSVDDGGRTSSRTACSPTRAPRDLPADGVVTGLGTRRTAAPVAVMANDSTVKAGSWGARTVEKIVRIQETAGRLRLPLFYLVDSAGARITDQIDMFPGRRGRRAHLLQPGAAVGRGAADLPAVRPVGGGRRVHPGVLRRRVHGREERVDVPRLAAHGRDGDRREGHARGDGRRADALRGLRLRRRAAPRPRRRRSRPRARYLVVPAAARRREAAGAPSARPPTPAASASTRSCRPTRTRPFDMHARDRRARRRGQLLRDQEALRARDRHRLRAHRRARRSASSPTSRSGRAACCSSTRPTRRRASSGCATRSTSRCSSWPTCPAS